MTVFPLLLVVRLWQSLYCFLLGNRNIKHFPIYRSFISGKSFLNGKVTNTGRCYWQEAKSISSLYSPFQHFFHTLPFSLTERYVLHEDIHRKHKLYSVWSSNTPFNRSVDAEKMTEWFHTYHPIAPQTPHGKTHPLTCKRGETRKSISSERVHQVFLWRRNTTLYVQYVCWTSIHCFMAWTVQKAFRIEGMLQLRMNSFLSLN